MQEPPDPTELRSPVVDLAAFARQSVAAPERAQAIGSRLRQIFDDAVAEPMPQAFEELLRRLG